jgi:predicted metal-dependent phosphoesterase TrpH
MKIDLHCHSKYSYDNYLEPEELIQQAIKRHLDGVCFTEHHSMTLSSPVEKMSVPEGFYLFRGLEISTDQGHLLVYGLKDDAWNKWSRNNYLDASAVVDIVHSFGGICVPAHPYRGWDSLGEDIMSIDGFDALETHNGLNSNRENQKAIQAAQLRDLPSIGGSDCHNKEQVGMAYTEFKNPVRNIDELIEEIKKGNCKGVTL